jgi:DNA-binding CsgD family transcriptional regulator
MPREQLRTQSPEGRIEGSLGGADGESMQASPEAIASRPGVATERVATPGSALERSYVRARLARTPRERVAAFALDTAGAFIPASIALLYDVDEHQSANAVMALRAPNCGAPATDDLARRITQLEPIDPFSVRRAHAAQSSTLSVADVGGDEELRRSMYGRHLRKLGLAAPLHAYLWCDGRIVSALALFREACQPAFRRADALLLAELEPLLADAIVFGRCAGGQVPVLPEERLTLREREVAWLVLAGVSNASVAERLGMTEATVKTHLTRIYAKLGIRSRTELATRFRRP